MDTWVLILVAVLVTLSMVVTVWSTWYSAHMRRRMSEFEEGRQATRRLAAFHSGMDAEHKRLWDEYDNDPQRRLEKWPENLRNDPRVRKIEGLDDQG